MISCNKTSEDTFRLTRCSNRWTTINTSRTYLQTKAAEIQQITRRLRRDGQRTVAVKHVILRMWRTQHGHTDRQTDTRGMYKTRTSEYTQTMTLPAMRQRITCPPPLPTIFFFSSLGSNSSVAATWTGPRSLYYFVSFHMRQIIFMLDLWSPCTTYRWILATPLRSNHTYEQNTVQAYEYLIIMLRSSVYSNSSTSDEEWLRLRLQVFLHLFFLN